MSESTSLNIDHTFRNHEFSQSGTLTKGSITNADHVLREGETDNICINIVDLVSQKFIPGIHMLHIVVTIRIPEPMVYSPKCSCPVCISMYIYHCVTVQKGKSVYVCHPVRNRDGQQAHAPGESLFFNSSHSIRHRDRSQILTLKKSVTANAGNSVGNDAAQDPFPICVPRRRFQVVIHFSAARDSQAPVVIKVPGHCPPGPAFISKRF